MLESSVVAAMLRPAASRLRALVERSERLRALTEEQTGGAEGGGRSESRLFAAIVIELNYRTDGGAADGAAAAASPGSTGGAHTRAAPSLPDSVRSGGFSLKHDPEKYERHFEGIKALIGSYAALTDGRGCDR